MFIVLKKIVPTAIFYRIANLNSLLVFLLFSLLYLLFLNPSLLTIHYHQHLFPCLFFPFPISNFSLLQFYDFEDWVIGTHKFSQGPYPRGDVLGFSTFSSNTTGALEFNSGTLRINTTALTMTLEQGCRDIEPDVDGVENSNCSEIGKTTEEITYNGVIHMTLGGTEVATFNFERIYLGVGVKVYTTGVRALSLLSRSSTIIDTPIIAESGTLGGFPGGRLKDDFNSNGPGSGSRRVFEKTVTTAAVNVDEIQRITTYATPGENLAGGFTLEYCRGAGSKAVECDVSERIP